MKKRIIAFLILLMLLQQSMANADRIPENIRLNGYIGAMRVAWCKEWVSLRAEPRKTSERLAQVPLNEILYNCRYAKDKRFVQCEYHGMKGYVLVGYLKIASDYEPPYSYAKSRVMTREEVIGTGEVVLDWNRDNITIVAAYETTIEKDRKWEVLRIGCFENEKPVWGQEEWLRIVRNQKPGKLKAFIGGTPDAPQVMLYDGGYGLSMLDLFTGEEKWNLRVQECYLGDAAVTTVDENGICYIAGTDGPDPIAVSQDGQVLWRSAISDPAVYEPYEIAVDNQIEVKYQSSSADRNAVVVLDLSGQVVSSQMEETETIIASEATSQTYETSTENEKEDVVIEVITYEAKDRNTDSLEDEGERF